MDNLLDAEGLRRILSGQILDQNSGARGEEIRTFNPSWQESVRAWLMGDNPSYMRRRMVEEGSAIPMAAGDVLSAPARDVYNSLQQGDYAGAGLTTGLAAFGGPVLSKAAQVGGAGAQYAAQAIRNNPYLSAAALGGAGVLADSAEAGPKAPRLSYEQRQALELERQRTESANNAALARQQAEARNELERQQAQATFNRQQQIDHETRLAAAQEAERQRQANMPFRERYPTLAESLPFVGGAVAMAVPYAARVGKTLNNNALTSEWRNRVAAAEQSLGGDMTRAQAMQLRNEMRAYGAQGAPTNSPNLTLTGAAAITPAELAMLPAEYDAVMLPAGSKDRDAARALLTDPVEIAKRAGIGLLQGMPAAMIGSKLPVPVPQAVAPTAETAGLIAAFEEAAKRKKRAAP